jgi:hypothetical protein
MMTSCGRNHFGWKFPSKPHAGGTKPMDYEFQSVRRLAENKSKNGIVGKVKIGQ